MNTKQTKIQEYESKEILSPLHTTDHHSALQIFPNDMHNDDEQDKFDKTQSIRAYNASMRFKTIFDDKIPTSIKFI